MKNLGEMLKKALSTTVTTTTTTMLTVPKSLPTTANLNLANVPNPITTATTTSATTATVPIPTVQPPTTTETTTILPNSAVAVITALSSVVFFGCIIVFMILRFNCHLAEEKEKVFNLNFLMTLAYKVFLNHIVP